MTTLICVKFYFLPHTGGQNHFTVNTVSTLAASTLAVTIDGPSKAEIHASEVRKPNTPNIPL